ncbi:MAG: hypothetical protein EZS28_018710, partial [Streblomastix strix]
NHNMHSAVRVHGAHGTHGTHGHGHGHGGHQNTHEYVISTQHSDNLMLLFSAWLGDHCTKVDRELNAILKGRATQSDLEEDMWMGDMGRGYSKRDEETIKTILIQQKKEGKKLTQIERDKMLKVRPLYVPDSFRKFLDSDHASIQA